MSNRFGGTVWILLLGFLGTCAAGRTFRTFERMNAQMSAVSFIRPGAVGQVLVTDSDGNPQWVDQDTTCLFNGERTTKCILTSTGPGSWTPADTAMCIANCVEGAR
jgi:hypothetical protein